MAKSQQKLNKVVFKKLKGLVALEIDFTAKPLVAILGPNGIGKSTILHALACINKPIANAVDHKLSHFFIPTTHSSWVGSAFEVYQDYRDGNRVTTDHKTHFRKVRSRWAPRYNTRIERYVSFIGIKTCVPIIENETQKSRITFNTTTPLTDQESKTIKELAGKILNKNYDQYSELTSRVSKRYIGVSTGDIRYSSLSMGAGEQRVFYILSEIVKASDYGLILIDEIDLLLHQDALFRLMRILNEIATHKHLQIIFTTHSHALLNLDFIATRHLYQTPEKTLCFETTKPDALQRLTGKQIRPLEIFVEDDLAEILVKKICSEEGLSKYVSIKLFGAAINCFTAVCGSILNQLENQENMLFVLDGDVYREEEDKRNRIEKVLTGNILQNNIQRNIALSRIRQFSLPNGQKPEKYYHSLICNLDNKILSKENIELVQVARQIQNPGNDHDFLNDIITRMDYKREVGLSKLIDLLSLSAEWARIKGDIVSWLNDRRERIVEN